MIRISHLYGARHHHNRVSFGYTLDSQAYDIGKNSHKNWSDIERGKGTNSFNLVQFLLIYASN